MHTSVRATLSAAAVAALALAGLAASPAANAADPVGSVTIQLATLAGAPLHLAGAVVQLDESTFEPVAQGTSDATGTVHFTGVLIGSGYDAVVLTTPAQGAGSYAPGETDHVTVAADETTSVTVPLAPGATVAGTLVTPSGAPAAGVTVDAIGDGARPWDVSVTTDAAGRYEVAGLASEIVELDAYGSPQGFPAQWKTQVEAGSTTRSPSHVVLSTRMVHTNYDLNVQVLASTPTPALVHATVRAVDVATGRTTDETTSSVLDSWQSAEWDLPTGSYRLEVITTATASVPSKTYWFTSGFTLSANPASALTIPVVFGTKRSYDESLPR